ncbi:MAG: secondary thiamine-phosphate synthase enzyme YjbQ [Candidatus Cloacimonadales bacterium]
MKLLEMKVVSKRKSELILLSNQLQELVQKQAWQSGKITLFVPHTTAAVTINENADPAVKDDILLGLDRISPVLAEFQHYEGNSDAHLKSSLIGCSQELLLNAGKLVLGTWQGLYFCEFDGPRQRRIIVGFVGE